MPREVDLRQHLHAAAAGSPRAARTLQRLLRLEAHMTVVHSSLDSPVGDLVVTNRLAVAAAYRRLAETALRACEAYSEHVIAADEKTVLAGVVGRVDNVKHALVVLEATRTGAARAQRKRGAA